MQKTHAQVVAGMFVCPGGSVSFLRNQAAQKKGAIGCSRGGDVDVCWCKEEKEWQGVLGRFVVILSSGRPKELQGVVGYRKREPPTFFW